jgi:HSP20 family molecular chaperone IbpA
MTKTLENLLNYNLDTEFRNFVNELRSTTNDWANWNPSTPFNTPQPTTNTWSLPTTNNSTTWRNPLTRNYNYKSYTTENGYVLTFDLPGYSKENLNVEITDNVLTIDGRREHGYGENTYTTTINERVTLNTYEYDSTKVTAEVTNGVLEVTLPKNKKDKKRTLTLI